MEESDNKHAVREENDSSLFGKRSSQDSAKDGKKNRLRREIESLHQEMEVTGYAKGKMGHKQRKVPRDVSKIRTQKRKLLEKLDDSELAILGDEDELESNGVDETDNRKSRMKRLRGSKVAVEDSIIQGSLVFSTASSTRTNKDENHASRNEDHLSHGGTDFDIDRGGEEEEDSDSGQGETVAATKYNNLDESPKQFRNAHKQQKVSKSNKSNVPSAKKRRKMYRLRNFQSLKMAEKHGNAIAAHARGQPRLAIEQLKEVAKAAPSAPQVYSSLGMVYEDMLRENIKRYENNPGFSTDESSIDKSKSLEEESNNSINHEGLKEVLIPNRPLAEQRLLATKAYGSYHVAAILCKKDFTLWVRAADSALDIAEIHNKVIKLPNLSKKLRGYHRTERRRWQDEALRDYIVADNLKPPGIDVPAKLALVHIELGNLSEALTILTDLKNRAGHEFRCSYKAWMLYSDLMLRLGHECVQWSKGIQTNENYMFRRWLRKFSKIFDWQERRLQGLSLALEAAAGTESVEVFLAWIRQRLMKTTKSVSESNSSADGPTKNPSESSPQYNITGDIELQLKERKNSQNNEEDERTGVNDETATTMKSSFAREKKLLLSNQSRELQSFDKTTSEMNLALDSTAAKERDIVRNSLLKQHDAATNKLLTEYEQKASGLSSYSKEQMETIVGMNTTPLPITGSIRLVCSIASELMKHLLGLELYEGAKLVGDAVSRYMKERARRYHVGIERRRRADEWQQNIIDSPFFLDSYDDDNGASNEVELTYLSDEETLLDDEEDSPLVKSLSKGALTPELRVLYGLALIGEGGRNFIAAKCLEAVNDLPQETEEWFVDCETETMYTVDSAWLLFRKAMTEELGRTGAYAFMADVLKKTNKESEWALHFSSWFRSHLETLKSLGFIDKVLDSREDVTFYQSFRKNQVLKVILQACTFDVCAIYEATEVKYALNKRPLFNNATKLKTAQTILTSLVTVIPSVWSIDSDGVLPNICAEIVKVVAKCIRWLSHLTPNQMPFSTLKCIVEQCTTIVSYLCGNAIPNLSTGDGKENFLTKTKKFPVSSSWQSTEFRMLSICAYNFAVACNVSLFSGWHSEEFSMKTLKKRNGQKRHFGVHIGDRRLAGCLPRTVEDELNRLWEIWEKMELGFPKLHFSRKMEIVKQSEWFQAEIKSRKETLRQGKIAHHGEEDALELFLGYAAICIQLSRSETDKRISTRCQQLAMSIILPLSQFCLDEALWDSDIGEAATTLASYEEWQILAGKTEYQPVGDREGLYPKRIRKSGRKVYDKKVQEWVEGVGSPTSKDFIPIPNIELKKLWMQDGSEKVKETGAAEAKDKMQKVHKAFTDLRTCYTYAAAEKGCLNLSIALLDVAASPHCHDPFTCLQQAACFASQATKSGNSDTAYRHSLPEVAQCSPTEALVILGRADCLQSVYFPNEAAYLCSFVARVCRLHRDSREEDYEWSDRWKMVAIYAYNVSVMIRITVSSILDQTMQKAFMAAWDRDVVEELERARKEGRAWISSITKAAGNTPSRKEIEVGNSGDNIEHYVGSRESGLELSKEAPGMQLIDSNTQYKPEELNKKVVQLLSTEIQTCEDEDNNLDDITQYSV